MVDEKYLAMLREVADAGGTVKPSFFSASKRGMSVAFLVKRGLLEWLREREPQSCTATALRLTEAGRGFIPEAPFKTRYVILEPGERHLDDLEALRWVDVTFDNSQPGYDALRAVLDPLFPDADWEQVAVNWTAARSNMFVDTRGNTPGRVLPENEAATLIYWTASKMHEVAQTLPAHTSYAMIRKAALIEADKLLGAGDDTPRIHGRAVLFADRVWF